MIDVNLTLDLDKDVNLIVNLGFALFLSLSLFCFFLKKQNKTVFGPGAVTQLSGCLSSTQKALASVPSPTYKVGHGGICL